ncbi:DMSO reductase anchor subunit [Aliiroseovarius crassostreae]|uniref:Dibenzothiophene desulfurase n=1 Tax=Aliiroseovarius crassostreae TaxID=154981 RepID=A0A0N8IC26_9RHOB|nr:DmsC/YnfH family molybdoenzyme membrane anchor subunit [Aliiroseovarius crassostreae]KPN64731.1 dibenzothiophene desulfurase [Aliiroseovarius crassostreae]SFU76653.1 DMSO reductase anchor subunit [Aliiroseovarius crassostreae]
MHPAPSVILFTTLSGLGFGLLAFLGLDIPSVRGGTALAFFVLAYALAVGGLLTSTFHLGNKKNAIYAFSQWRSSWLSREGCAAVLTLLLFAPVGFGRVFLETNLGPLGAIGSISALATVFTTSMIYAQLRTIPRWHQPIVPVMFLLHALAGGALLAGQSLFAGLLLLALTGVMIWMWREGDRREADGADTMESATGLGTIGKVRMYESAHTARNYVMDEMIHRVGRKHAEKLRKIAAVLIGILPAIVLLALPAGHLVSAVAFLLHLVGIAVGRWLFFAEARHVVGLYYGK